MSGAVENILLNVQTNDEAVKLAGSNIAVSVLPLAFIPRGAVLKNWGSNVTILSNDSDQSLDQRVIHFENIEAAVIFPENLLNEKLKSDQAYMVIIVRRNFHFVENFKVVSPVISIVIGRKHVYDLDPPVEMIFNVSKVINIFICVL